MKKVEKAMMFVWRDNNGIPEFFVLHRTIGDRVILTGHLEAGETPSEAANREIQEELGVLPLSLQAIPYISEVILEDGHKQSVEHPFLVQIPNQPVEFLEYEARGEWHPFAELTNLLTYEGQKSVLPYIEKII